MNQEKQCQILKRLSASALELAKGCEIASKLDQPLNEEEWITMHAQVGIAFVFLLALEENAQPDAPAGTTIVPK